MAELIIMLRDNYRRGQNLSVNAYRPGDIVDILADGIAEQSKDVAPPVFGIIRVPGASVARLWELGYCREDFDNDLGGEVYANRRRFFVDLSRLSAIKRNRLTSRRNGLMVRRTAGASIDLTVNQLLGLVKNKRTNVTEQSRGRTASTWGIP